MEFLWLLFPRGQLWSIEELIQCLLIHRTHRQDKKLILMLLLNQLTFFVVIVSNEIDSLQRKEV